MPSEPMNIQEQGFRSSLFGFDKNDVLAYMNAARSLSFAAADRHARIKNKTAR